MEATTVLILDASVLINFLRVDRMGLFSQFPARLLVTEHVVAEISSVYPEQVERLNSGLSSGLIAQLSVTDLHELQAMAELRSGEGKRRLGLGECSAIAVAASRGYELAIDDKAALKQIKALYPSLKVHTTVDLVVALIRENLLDVPTADAIKTDWAANHRFVIKIASFADLL